MAALSNAVFVSKRHSLGLASGSSFVPGNLSLGPNNLAFSSKSTKRSSARIQASYRDDGRSGSAVDIFFGGFILGGLVAGAVACAYAPQISKALSQENQKKILKRLPKFVYDEEKALEKERKKLYDKVARLNATIDTVSGQIRIPPKPKYRPKPKKDEYDEIYGF